MRMISHPKEDKINQKTNPKNLKSNNPPLKNPNISFDLHIAQVTAENQESKAHHLPCKNKP